MWEVHIKMPTSRNLFVAAFAIREEAYEYAAWKGKGFIVRYRATAG